MNWKSEHSDHFVKSRRKIDDRNHAADGRVRNMMDYSFLVIDFIAFFTILGIGYYASRIMIQMRSGLLEKSWRYLVASAYVLEGAVVLYLVQQFTNSAFTIAVTSHLSAVLLVIGGIYVLFGFRAHYVVFSPKHPKTDMKEFIDR